VEMEAVQLTAGRQFLAAKCKERKAMSVEVKPKHENDQPGTPEELSERQLEDIAGGTGTGAIIPHSPPTPGG